VVAKLKEPQPEQQAATLLLPQVRQRRCAVPEKGGPGGYPVLAGGVPLGRRYPGAGRPASGN